MKNSISYLGLKQVRGRGDCYNALGLVRTVVLIPRANALGYRLPVSHAPSCIVTTNPSRNSLNPWNITNVLPFLKLCSPWKCFSHYCPFVRGFHRISSKRDSCGLWCFCRYLKQILKEQWSFRRFQTPRKYCDITAMTENSTKRYPFSSVPYPNQSLQSGFCSGMGVN